MEQKFSQTSMIPLIQPGDKPLVKKTTQYDINDIVVFKKSERLIAHRIIYKSLSGKYFITKGDNELKPDGKIIKTQILGRVEAVERGGQVIKLTHFYLSQSSVYLKQLEKINKVFNKNKISYIILKGLPLHIHFDNAPPQRLYLDADLLIKKKDFDNAKKLLIKLGYEERQSKLFKEIVDNPTQITLTKNTKPFPTAIDLHLEPAIGFTKIRNFNQLIPALGSFEKYLFKNLQTISVNKTKFPILNINKLLIYLLIHLFHHNFKGPYRMEFIDSLVRNQKIDWIKIKEILHKYKLNNFTYPSILALKRYYQTPIPPDVFTPIFGQKLISCIVIKLAYPFGKGSIAKEGIVRFILLLLLSPLSCMKKVRILSHKDTWVYFLTTIKSFFSRS